VCKYIMKAQRGLNCIEDIDTGKRCRADGSIPEFIQCSKGRKNGGVGYRAIDGLVDQAKRSGMIVNALSAYQVHFAMDAIRRINSNPGEEVLEPEWDKMLAESGLTMDQVNAITDVFRLETEWWSYFNGDKKISIRPPAYWRERFWDRLGMPKAAREAFKEANRNIIEIRESRKPEGQKLQEAAENKKHADKWKRGSYEFSDRDRSQAES